MAETLLLKYSSEDVHKPQPWPVSVDENGTVLSGLGPDDGAHLVGFGPAGQQTVTVWRADAWENPDAIVGMSATFSKNDQMFLWKPPVASATRMPTT